MCNLCERIFHAGCIKNHSFDQSPADWFCPNCKPMIIVQPKVNNVKKKVKIRQNISSDEYSDSDLVISEHEHHDEDELSPQPVTRSKRRKVDPQIVSDLSDESEQQANVIATRSKKRKVNPTSDSNHAMNAELLENLCNFYWTILLQAILMSHKLRYKS